MLVIMEYEVDWFVYILNLDIVFFFDIYYKRLKF